MKARPGIDQLRHDANVIAVGAQHAAFENVRDTEIAADLPDVDVAPPVSERRGARRHFQSRRATQGLDQLFSEAVSEIIQGRIAGDVGERDHGDGGGSGYGRRGFGSGGAGTRVEPHQQADDHGRSEQRTAHECEACESADAIGRSQDSVASRGRRRLRGRRLRHRFARGHCLDPGLRCPRGRRFGPERRGRSERYRRSGPAVRRLRWPDLRHEPVPPPGHRHDEPVLARRFAQRLAKQGDVAIEAVLLDHHAWPHRLHHRALVDHLAAVLDEINQGVQGFGGQRNGLARAGRVEQPPLAVQPETLELVLHAYLSAAIRRFQTMSGRIQCPPDAVGAR